MKYRVTVDGTAFTVEVESMGASAAYVSQPVIAAAPEAAPAEPAPVAALAPTPTTPASKPAPAGGVTITSPMPGKILKVLVSVGQVIKSGDVVIILEAMKMENEIFSTSDGKVIEVSVGNGDAVNAGDVLVTIG